MLHPHNASRTARPRCAQQGRLVFAPTVLAVCVVSPRRALLAARSGLLASALEPRLQELSLERPRRGALVVLLTRGAEHRVLLSRRSKTLETLLESMAAFREAGEA